MIQWQISHTLATRAENVSEDWHDLRECVKLTSTRWINAITGQTWKGENPFKARKAKQGPWLIHLANLRVMYECQGTLVRQGDRRVCVYSVDMVSVYFWKVGGLHVKMLFGCKVVSLRCTVFSPHSTPLGISSKQSQWSLVVETTKRCTEGPEWEGSGIALQMRCGNVAVVCWAAEWVPECSAIPRAQSGPVSTSPQVKRLLFQSAAGVVTIWQPDI